MKTRDLSDLNDLYNIILLLEIIGNRFETMYNETMFNPRKNNSASKLSGSIQHEQSKVILTLSANNSITETFEKKLNGGFSCVNTRFVF